MALGLSDQTVYAPHRSHGARTLADPLHRHARHPCGMAQRPSYAHTVLPLAEGAISETLGRKAEERDFGLTLVNQHNWIMRMC